MGVLKKWILAPAKLPFKYKPFSKTVKSVSHLEAVAKKNKALKYAIKTIFNKGTVTVALGGTAIGVGISKINNYIQSNSGCFIKTADSVCKVNALSCCQPDSVDNLPHCNLQPKQLDPCRGFDEDKEQTCCRFCDCQVQNCLPNETMECRRPTIAEALTHFAGTLTSSFWRFLTNLFPSISWILGIVGGLLALWIGLSLYQKVR